jgi:hypothetical protein
VVHGECGCGKDTGLGGVCAFYSENIGAIGPGEQASMKASPAEMAQPLQWLKIAAHKTSITSEPGHTLVPRVFRDRLARLRQCFRFLPNNHHR